MLTPFKEVLRHTAGCLRENMHMDAATGVNGIFDIGWNLILVPVRRRNEPKFLVCSEFLRSGYADFM